MPQLKLPIIDAVKHRVIGETTEQVSTRTGIEMT